MRRGGLVGARHFEDVLKRGQQRTRVTRVVILIPCMGQNYNQPRGFAIAINETVSTKVLITTREDRGGSGGLSPNEPAERGLTFLDGRDRGKHTLARSQ